MKEFTNVKARKQYIADLKRIYDAYAEAFNSADRCMRNLQNLAGFESEEMPFELWHMLETAARYCELSVSFLMSEERRMK